MPFTIRSAARFQRFFSRGPRRPTCDSAACSTSCSSTPSSSDGASLAAATGFRYTRSPSVAATATSDDGCTSVCSSSVAKNALRPRSRSRAPDSSAPNSAGSGPGPTGLPVTRRSTFGQVGRALHQLRETRIAVHQVTSSPS